MNKQKPVMKTSTIELPGGFILQHQEPDEENYYTEQMMDEAIKEISEPYIKEERQRLIEEVIELIKKKYISKRKENDGSDESWNVRAAYYNFALDDIIKSLSLTKESK